jgi:hypothetical protein
MKAPALRTLEAPQPLMRSPADLAPPDPAISRHRDYLSWMYYVHYLTMFEDAVCQLSLETNLLGEDCGSVIQIGQAGGKGSDSQVTGQRIGELKAGQGFVINLG